MARAYPRQMPEPGRFSRLAAVSRLSLAMCAREATGAATSAGGSVAAVEERDSGALAQLVRVGELDLGHGA